MKRISHNHLIVTFKVHMFSVYSVQFYEQYISGKSSEALGPWYVMVFDENNASKQNV